MSFPMSFNYLMTLYRKIYTCLVPYQLVAIHSLANSVVAFNFFYFWYYEPILGYLILHICRIFVCFIMVIIIHLYFIYILKRCDKWINCGINYTQMFYFKTMTRSFLVVMLQEWVCSFSNKIFLCYNLNLSFIILTLLFMVAFTLTDRIVRFNSFLIWF